MRALLNVLPGRVGFGRTLDVVSKGMQLTLQPGADAPRVSSKAATISLDADGLREFMSTVRAERGEYPLPGCNMTVEVEPTLVRDNAGNVVETVG